MAVSIAVNAKTQRPSVCNAAETLVVHSQIAPEFLPRAFGELLDRGVELRVDGRARSLAGDAAERTTEATERDWATEFHDLILAVKVVDSAEEAIDHINRWSSGHSEAVVTSSDDVARAFTTEVDAACVYVNASTRFTDGAEFGMGAEIGNSTQKLHARGPIGTRELCSFKWIARGDGQIKE
jgi:glutamate-5-semialdehyde dehydrogenase